MSTALLAARCALAVVFLIAAITKLAQPERFRLALGDLGAPARAVGFLSWGIPVLEIALALLLLVDATASSAAVAAMAVLAAFSVVIARALRRGELADCGCFGQASSPVSNTTLTRNAGLIVLAVPVAVGGSGRSLSSVGLPGESFVAVVGLTTVAVLSFGCWRLLRRRGRLTQRTRKIEAGLAQALADGKSSGLR